MLTNRIMRGRRCNEITRNKSGPLVDQLVKSVLTVGAGLSPDDGTGLVIHWLTVAVNAFSVGFHITLLEVSWETVEVLLVVQNGFGLCTDKVSVPDADEVKLSRDVLFQRSVEDVLIHTVHPIKELNEMIIPDGEGDAHTAGAGEGVATADPVPKAVDIPFCNTELFDAFNVAR